MKNIKKYIYLLHGFSVENINASEFCRNYFNMYNDETDLEVYDQPVLKEIFWMVEDFVPEKNLRASGELTEMELLDHVRGFLVELNSLQ